MTKQDAIGELHDLEQGARERERSLAETSYDKGFAMGKVIAYSIAVSIVEKLDDAGSNGEAQ